MRWQTPAPSEGLVAPEPATPVVTGAVRWRESVVGIAHAGVDHFVEVGGKVLTGMVRKIAPDARATSLVTIEDVRAFGGEGS